ncbi:hypothetical protein D3OALGA1CA_4931 [Olavius algarvensis associated proteobacterium Delta 3]|nr:hypothetical protein D3OALGB2SA_2215 [Olavius algarvensis associated proteobacterium Delta 3]CAB5159062.1 hypothetical protein D3OALGA1CA_4931 [Olavius algarvensis associated proteobacterium Delta 3]
MYLNQGSGFISRHAGEVGCVAIAIDDYHACHAGPRSGIQFFN